MACLKEALIDDCTLAAKVKESPSPTAADGKSRIWLGLGSDIISLRPYPDLDTVWKMVARTAFTQLNYSALLLVGTLVSMVLIYLVAPIGLVWSLVTANWIAAGLAAITWGLMSLSYWPTLKFYRQVACVGVDITGDRLPLHPDDLSTLRSNIGKERRRLERTSLSQAVLGFIRSSAIKSKP